MTVTTLGVLAATWGLVMALSPVLQIRRIVRRRSSSDISIGYFLVLILGFGLWIVYGIGIGDPVLIVPNSAALVTGAVTIGVALRYRSRPAERVERDTTP